MRVLIGTEDNHSMSGSQATGAVKCEACGGSNPPDFQFCSSCGTSLGRRCPTCRSPVGAAARFCGVCGSALGERPAPPADQEIEERKVVTVVFADLTASTELAARLDPEDLRAVLRPFFEAMVDEIRRFDGTVEKFIGDAIVAVFGVPASHEDDPVRAVRAALSMHRRLEVLNPQLAASQGVELAMRIGVNTGEVVTATGVDQSSLVTGEPVNIAARFQALADPGGTVVGERTYRDAQHVIQFRSIGEVSVKGIDRLLPAWTVVGEAPAGSPTAARPGRRGPMVGREEELDLLELMFARTIRQSRPSLVTVIGPAGIGKSRLAYEVAVRLRARGAAKVIRGRCLPYGDGLTYWPMAEILKADVGILDNDDPEAIARKTTASLEGRFQDEEERAGTIRVLLSSIGIPVAPDPLAGAEPAAARELIARSWRAYLETLAAGRPLLAQLGDLHWADESLLDLVENLAARVSAPVMFLILAAPISPSAVRPGGAASGIRPPWRSLPCRPKRESTWSTTSWRGAPLRWKPFASCWSGRRAIRSTRRSSSGWSSRTARSSGPMADGACSGRCPPPCPTRCRG